MTDAEWMGFLDTLTPSERKLAQAILAKIQHVLERDRSRALGETQRMERRADSQGEKIGMLHVRVDRLADLLEKIELRCGGDDARD